MTRPAWLSIPLGWEHPGAARRAHRRRARLIGLLVAAVFAVLLTAWGIQTSYRNGRLAGFPIPDDVGALYSGAVWVPLWEHGGLGELWRSWRQVPPHSPYSTGSAFVSFLVLGIHDWAPYTTCALQVFVALAFVNSLMRGAGAWARALTILTVGTVPLLSFSVQNLKGDYLAGILTAMLVVMAIGRPYTRSGSRRHVLIGVVMAGALMAKPSVFAPTILLCGFALLMGAVAERFAPGPRPALRKTVRAWAISGVVTAVLIAPYFVFAARRLWDYMYDNIFGAKKSFWEVKGSFWFETLFFITGKGSGHGMLGVHAYVFLGLLVVGLILTLGWGRRYGVARAVAYAAVIFAAYLMPTLNPVKNHLLGLAFQCLITFVAVVVLAGMLHRQRRARWAIPWASPLVIGAAAVTCGSFHYLEDWNPHNRVLPGTPSLRERNELLESVVTTLDTRARQQPGVLLIADGVGDFNCALLGYKMIQDGIAINVVPTNVMGVSELEARLPHVDLVLACEEGTGMLLEWHPASKNAAAMLEYMRTRPEFAELKRFPVPPSNRAFVLFQRVR